MLIRYDGSFDGLLSAIFDIYAFKMHVTGFLRPHEHHALLGESVYDAEIDSNKFNRVSEGISRKISPVSLESLWLAHASGFPSIENHILEYIRRGFLEGTKVEDRLTTNPTAAVNDAARRTSREKHRYLGLIRFKEIQPGLFYAPFAPEAHVLPLIASHFRQRLATQSFIIHDVPRELAACYDGNNLLITELSAVPDKTTFFGGHIEDLWRTYYHSVSIPERKNPRCLKNHMPVKSWAYLPERHLPSQHSVLTDSAHSGKI